MVAGAHPVIAIRDLQREARRQVPEYEQYRPPPLDQLG